MIITSYSNIDFIQGVIGYGNATEGITDWRLENTGAGVFNIQNSSSISIITPSGGTTEIGQIANSIDRYMIFKEGTSTFTVPSGGIVCDILIVGGGGAGGAFGGGGGAGQVLYGTNVFINSGTVNINVGNGGATTTGLNVSQNGFSSSITIGGITYSSVGGGGGGGRNSANFAVLVNGNNGGSGGGGNTPDGTLAAIGGLGGSSTKTSYSGWISYGNSGGYGIIGDTHLGGGGGGAGGVGGSVTLPSTSGAGGIGVDFSSIFGTSVGASGWFGGGGGGCLYGTGSGGLGGTGGGGKGGQWSPNTPNGVAGTVNTGGGGGASGLTSGYGYGTGGAGGSGIVIIRYSIANISIIDNGNVGIGTTPITSSSKLEIYGDINISGNYKLNNRDVINDTSNYMLTTSNTLVPRIITEVGHGSNYVSRIATQINTRIDDTSNYVARTSTFLANNVSSQWTNVSSGIHFTPTTSTPVITSTPVAPTIGTTGDYTYMVFTYTTETAGAGTGQSLYTINVPTGGVVCDILLVGGGGGGDKFVGGGGGGGAVLYATNVNIPVGSYTIKVGKGGVVNQNGSSTEAFGATCLGGGSTLFVDWATPNNGRAGGSGSGGSAGGSTGTGGGVGTSTKGTLLNSATLYNGNSGGNGLGQVGISSPYFGQPVCSGGGGGAGSAGLSSKQVHYTTRSSWIADGKPGTGGDGVQINITGTTYYWGAGGGGSSYDTHAGDGGLGGGGGGASSYSRCPEGFAGTGGINNGNNGTTGDVGGNAGNGTGSGGGGGNVAGNGGSGIIIIRFLSSTRNVGIGTTYPTSELHVYDDTTNNTKLTVQNSYIDPVIISPNTIGYTVAETVESNKFYRTLTFNYFPNYPEDLPNTSLLAWYRFDGNGLDYNPYVTKYNLVAGTGTPTYSSGTTADSFLQGRRYINLAAGSLKSTNLALASRAFSVAVWVRTKITTDFFFIFQGTGNLNTGLCIGGRGNNSYCLAFFYNDLECGSGVSGNPTSYPGDKDNWVYMVYVVLPNYNRRIYRNGVLISTDSNTSAFTGTGEFIIGTNLNVDISDLRIYSTGLSATEVATLYSSYTNLVITNNYSVNFNKSTTLLVNNVSKTVNGAYLVSMGNINSSMVPTGGQTDIPLASTAITSLPIKYEYSNTAYSLPALITVSGATSSIIGTTERCISFTYTSDTLGLTGQTQYTFTPTEDIWCDILVVGGGGGGGRFGGGGGGGGVLLATNLKLSGGISVIVKVGDGGTGATSVNTGVNGVNGYNSSIIINSIEYIAKGGGGGGTRNGSPYIGKNGNDGGSGGGGSTGDPSAGFAGISNKNNYANFQSFGNNGGNGVTASPWMSGGGGGAGSIGSNASYTTGGGNGGRGKDFISYFGTNVGHMGWFAGGGGGNVYYDFGNRGYGNGGLGLYGGGGNSGYDGTLPYFADNGLINTGGGGGGGNHNNYTISSAGGKGGSGFVIIRYRKIITQSASLELITSSSINISEPTTTFDRINKNTGMTGWVQIKHLPKAAEVSANRTWFSGNTFNGSTVNSYTVGSPSNNDAEWSIPFDTANVKYYLFYENTSDFNGEWNDRWIVMKKSDMVEVGYPNFKPFYKALNYPTGKTEGLQYNRINNVENADPNINIEHLKKDGTVSGLGPYKYGYALYLENSTPNWNGAPPAEVNVYVKYTEDIPITISRELTNYNYKYMLFTHSGGTEEQTSYTVNFPENTVCDILIVGGGGSGAQYGGGGGGGDVLYFDSVLFTSGTYTVKVGKGGFGNARDHGTHGGGYNGNNSSIIGGIINITAGGGGGGGGYHSAALSGTSISYTNPKTGISQISSGGGGGSIRDNSSASGNTVSGDGATNLNNSGAAGGGGGAGGISNGSLGNAPNKPAADLGGNGGIGYESDITGVIVQYGGGGGGGDWTDPPRIPGLGVYGGGNGGNPPQNGVAGTGGGGGGRNETGTNLEGQGGTGIVIIRYRSTIIGNQGYNIGNYNGDFKIISTTSSPLSTISTNTDFMRITRDGASIYNSTGSPLWSTVSDRRIKENIEKASYDKCYESIDKLELYRFSYIKELNNINKDLKQLGYIAQEVQGIFPKAVSTQEFHNNNLSISDMLSIDVTQINYSLYGAVKKLIEMYNDIEKQISIIENILNIDNTILNIPIDTSSITSNLILDTSNSNIALDTSNSNIALDTSNSNITLDTTTSNITLDTSNSNITLDTTMSNLTLDTSNSNIALDTSNSNIILDTSNSNLTLNTTTSNLSN